MNSIPGFWDVGPHEPIHVESSWQEFVRQADGAVVADLVAEPRSFENADFLFAQHGVVAELKEVETEFSRSPAVASGFDALMGRAVAKDPEWRPPILGGAYPNCLAQEFIRLFRPPLSRILKKANRQIRDTKAHFGITTPTGLLLLVNDGFTALEPHFVRSLACGLLTTSYPSVDCLLYLTVNRYVEIAGSNTPILLVAPSYSDRVSDSFVDFVENLCLKWGDFLEAKIGPFTERGEIPSSALHTGTRAIVLPGERRG
jgi:hypothetical protein